jgi:hypothetical protein
MEAAFFNSPEFTTIMLLLIFTFIAYKARFPHELAFTFATGLVGIMWFIFPTAVMTSLLAISVLATAVYLVRGIIKTGGKTN